MKSAKRALWFFVALGASVAVTLGFVILPLAANGFEGTGAMEKQWAFWVPWALVHGLRVLRRQSPPLGSRGRPVLVPGELEMSLAIGWPWAPAR